METKARECIGYEIASRLGFGRRFIISEMDYTSAGMEIIGAVDKVYFIEKSAYEKLQKRVQELEAENARLREALLQVRHHVIGHKGNGEILTVIDSALGEGKE